MAAASAETAASRTRQRLREADKLHHIHSFTDHAGMAGTGAFIVEQAKGCKIAGEGGITLIDAMAGLGCVNVGYGRDELADTAAAAMREMAYYHTFQATTNPQAAALAERIAEYAPGGLDRVFFANSGSEANETIVKLVRAYWRAHGQPERRLIISRDYAYHGSSLYTAGLNGLPATHAAFGLPMADTAHIQAPYWYREGGEMRPEAFGKAAADALRAKIDALGAENVAAFIAEPIQVTAGAIVPPATYWPAVAEICRENGILLIADEVVTGFGRTGYGFGQEAYGFEADCMTLAKGLASGYQPIAAAVASDALAEAALEQGEAFQHGFTTSGHPVACAVALENLAILERENLIQRAGEQGAYLGERLARLGDHPLVGEIRTKGLLAGIELVKDKTTREQYPLERAVCAQVAGAALRRGVVLRPTGNSLVICPPFTIAGEEIDAVVQALAGALDEVQAQL